jgi:hypothetical protein
MKNRCEIWATLAEDMASMCSVDATRDIAYVTGRVATEGDAFLQVSLPQFAKDLEHSLDSFCVPAYSFAGFHRARRVINVGSKGKKHGHGIPVFLGNFMHQIFDDSFDVSWNEYLEIQRLSNLVDNGIPLGHRFPPMIRIPDTEEQVNQMANAIAAIRQLCLVFGKEKEQCSDSAISDAVEGYKSCEEELMLPFTTEG